MKTPRRLSVAVSVYSVLVVEVIPFVVSARCFAIFRLGFRTLFIGLSLGGFFLRLDAFRFGALCFKLFLLLLGRSEVDYLFGVLVLFFLLGLFACGRGAFLSGGSGFGAFRNGSALLGRVLRGFGGLLGNGSFSRRFVFGRRLFGGSGGLFSAFLGHAFFELFWELDPDSVDAYVAEHPEAIANGWEKFYVNEAGLDQSGTSMISIYDEPVLAIDAESGVLLLRIQDTGYRGVLAVGKDPAALSIEMCSTLGSCGQLIGTTAEEHDGVLAMNASGFLDPGGNGNGGQLAGYAMSNGEAHGTHFGAWAYKRIELHEDNLFYIKDANSTVGEGCTDATEFQPAMIIDGVKYTTDYWTDTQPRACIGQSDKYEILMLVIEGRYPLDGIVGTSVNTCSDILLKHGCMQAMNLDGGSSAMMWFDGKYVMQSSSSPLRYSGGRPTPNAWVYKHASAITEE